MWRKDNGGQSLASKEGFEASSGEYVVFLDADDYLLPALSRLIFSSICRCEFRSVFPRADMIQAVQFAHGARDNLPILSEYVRSGRGKSPGHHCAGSTKALLKCGRCASPDASIEDQVHLIEPAYAGDWMWAPTSGNCFRRDALQLFLNNEDLAALRSCTDAYLIRGINVLTGSVVIDRPLAVYRLHGMNVFSKHPHLNGMLSYDRGGPSDDDQLGRKMIIDHLIANAQLFLRKMHSPHGIT